MKFTEEKNPNNGLLIYHKGKFLGCYCSTFEEIHQFSGLKNQLFDKNLMAEFLKIKHPESEIYIKEDSAGNQMYLKISTEKYNLGSKPFLIK